MPLAAGTRLGSYEILSLLGAGGMGEVYRARDVRLDRFVALKVLAASVAGDPERRVRFEREAKIVATLSHANVLALYDVGDVDGVIFVVTELLDGESLRQRMAEGALPVRKAIDIAVQIARGLGAAHARGIVHRDLKPENVFVLPDGQIKVLDFGLARSIDGGSGATATQTNMALTDPGTVMGTVGYMAPEQIRGQALDARADLFALGVVLYEMIAGQPAFRRETPAETMTAILREDVPDLPAGALAQSPALDRIVRHCLEKNPTERFQTARDVAFALETLSGTTAVKSQALDAPPRPRDYRGKAGWIVAAMMTVALVAVAVSTDRRRDRALASAGVAASAVRYQPVTFEEGFVYAARFAPDQRTIVYSAEWDQQPRDIFVTSVDNLERRSLGFRGADLLSVSKSGALALLLDATIPSGNPYARRGTLARASLTGGAPRRESEGVWFADFAPDDSIAAVHWGDRPGAGPRLEWPAGRVIADLPLMSTAIPNPRISPQGDYIAAFVYTTAMQMNVRIMDRSGKIVADSQPFYDWWGLAWHPDGREVWFAAAEKGGRQSSLFALDLKGQQRLLLAAPGSLTVHDIAADGRVLGAFDQIMMRVEVQMTRNGAPRDFTWRDGGRPVDISSNGTVLSTSMMDSAGTRGAVYVRRFDDSEPVKISDGIGLALSPDGGTALVQLIDANLRLQLVPTAAGLARPFDVGGLESVGFVDWLPDGRIVMGARRKANEPWATYVTTAAGGALTSYLPSGVVIAGDHSPDGTRAVAVRNANEPVVCTLPTAGDATCTPVPSLGSGDEFAGWAPDSRSVLVYRRYPVPARVDRIDLASGRRELWSEVRPLDAAVSGLRELIAAPDGRLIYSYERDRSRLFVISGLR